MVTVALAFFGGWGGARRELERSITGRAVALERRAHRHIVRVGSSVLGRRSAAVGSAATYSPSGSTAELAQPVARARASVHVAGRRLV